MLPSSSGVQTNEKTDVRTRKTICSPNPTRVELRCVRSQQRMSFNVAI